MEKRSIEINFSWQSRDINDIYDTTRGFWVVSGAEQFAGIELRVRLSIILKKMILVSS